MKKYKIYTNHNWAKCLLVAVLGVGLSVPAFAGRGEQDDNNEITLMQFSDLHGKMLPHQDLFPGNRASQSAGGLAKVATMVKRVRKDNPNSLLLNVGDTTHGSAEANFTLR